MDISVIYLFLILNNFLVGYPANEIYIYKKGRISGTTLLFSCIKSTKRDMAQNAIPPPIQRVFYPNMIMAN